MSYPGHYTSREIADKLYRYARLIEAEANRRKALSELTEAENWLALEREAEETQSMANYLHEIKERL